MAVSDGVQLVSGKRAVREWRVRVNGCTYVGLGLVPRGLVEMQKEFHRAPHSYVYYWNGAAWKNGAEDAESTAGFKQGDVVSLRLDVDDARLCVRRNGEVIKVVNNVAHAETLRLGVILRSWSSVKLI